MTGKTWIIFVAVVVVLFGGLIIWSQKDKLDVAKVNTSKIQPATVQSGNIADHVFGNKNAKVVLIEYGDYQCPGCGSVYPTVKTVTEKYKDNLAFVFRNFPLTNIHPNARAAAAAAETAGLMGKYWEMHDILYENQSSWSDANANDRTGLFASYAEQIGLTKDAFTKELDKKSGRVNKKINYDIALGRKDNVTGTPTFYLNGKQVSSDDVSSEETFTKTIESALKQAGVDVNK